MSFGISLSQLISSNTKPLKSGIGALDEYLEDGFQMRCIYEIYGPPGIGKTRLGMQIVKNFQCEVSGNDYKALWIETFKCAPRNLMNKSHDFDEDTLDCVQLTKFTALLKFFERILLDNNNHDYKLIVIDGFSGIIKNQLNNILKRTNPDDNSINLHEIKCRHLINLFTLMTKYIHSTGSTIVLLNNCMNTAFNTDLNLTQSVEDNLKMVDGGNNFLVKTNKNNYGNSMYGNRVSSRKNVQILRSELVSNVGIGTKDSRWEVFIKSRIGIFWDWDIKHLGYITKNRKKLRSCRVAIVDNLQEKIMKKDVSDLNDKSSALNSISNLSQDNNYSTKMIKIYCDTDGNFISKQLEDRVMKKRPYLSHESQQSKKKLTQETFSQSTQTSVSDVSFSYDQVRQESIQVPELIKNVPESSVTSSSSQFDEVVYESEG